MYPRLLASKPTFSATHGISPEGIAAQAFWRLLYEHKADLVLNGHDHLYARYRPLDPSGHFVDPKRGITEFIVGSGGETLDPVVTTPVEDLLLLRSQGHSICDPIGSGCPSAGARFHGFWLSQLAR